FTDGNGCVNSDTISIIVNPLPVIAMTSVSALCIDASAVTLAATPLLGTFAGTGVTGTSFDPATAGAGTHIITYSFTDENGCANSDTISIIVNPLPVIAITSVSTLCIDASAVTLAATPLLGTFSGTGVTGTSFDPATSGAGTHIITYSFTDGNGCVNSATIEIIVNPLPVIAITSVSALCIDASAVTLAATPLLGTFSGTGVSGTSFDPATAGAGTHIITYSFTDGNGCVNSDTIAIIVNPLPVITMTSVSALCIDASAVTLAATPLLGTFSGTGVTGTSFDPATAGAGTHIITYSFTDGNGCANSDTISILVNPLPIIAMTSVSALCIDASAVTLAATPLLGTFSGIGVTGTSFDPATSGIGTHIITYSFTDGNGCVNSDTISIIVNPLPVIAITSVSALCIDANAVTLAATPLLGTFSGTGVTGTSFDPATAGAGTHIITYSFTDGNGCTNSDTISIIVNPLPVIVITSVSDLCIDASAVTLVATPLLGTFSGTGVTGTSFDPTTAGAGTHIITYSFTDGNGCVNSATIEILVNSLPVIVLTSVPALCIDASAVTLVATPVGGTFTGTGVAGGDFDPTTAGAGTHTVTYEYIDENTCKNSATIEIVVDPLPVIVMTSVSALCIDASAVTLVATPVGGTFTGIGVTGGDFDPASAGAGTHTVTYEYIDGNTCENSATIEIVVDPLPVIVMTSVSALCIDASAVTLVATPVGGAFTGVGVTGDDFDPAIAGAGTHTVTYEYTDGNGCVNSAITNILVHPLPTTLLGITGAKTVCLGGVTTLSTAETGTIVWSSSNETIATINAASGEVLSHTFGTINITFTREINGCVSSQSENFEFTVEDPSPPVGVQNQLFCKSDLSKISDIAITGLGITWYDAMINGNILSSSTVLTVGSYYATANDGTCESTKRLQVDITLSDPVLPVLAIGGATFCASDSPTISQIVANLTIATGTNLKWYDSNNLTTATALATNTPLINGTDYFVYALIDGCHSTSALSITTLLTDLSTPVLADNGNVFCASDSPTVADLSVNTTATSGDTIKWYTTLTGTTEYTASDSLINGMKLYGVAENTNCESTVRLPVEVSLTTVEKPLLKLGGGIFCLGNVTPTIEDLKGNIIASEPTNVVHIYSNITGGLPIEGTIEIPSNANSSTMTTYYAGQEDANGCLSVDRLEVSVTLVNGETPELAVTPVDLCAVDQPLVSDLSNYISTGNGGELRVFTLNDNTGTALDSDTNLSSQVYYVFEALPNDCTTTTSLSIKISLLNPPAPSVKGTAVFGEFCAIDTPTIEDLENQLEVTMEVNWYTDATKDTAVLAGTILLDGASYFAYSLDDKGCEGLLAQEAEVNLKNPVITSLIDPVKGSKFCKDDMPTVNDLLNRLNPITGTTFDIYDAITGGVLANSTDVLVHGKSYFIASKKDSCEGISRFEVVIDMPVLTVDAGVTNELTCDIPGILLSGTTSSTNVDKVLTYAWTTSDGNIISGATTLTPGIDKKGTYTLTVTDTDNGCSISDTVIITEDIVQPTAEAGATAELTCTTTSLTLNGVATSANVDKVLTYAWATSDGNIVSGATTLTPSIDQKGTYTFTVTDTDNGCSISDTVIITEDIVQPTAEAGATAELTCTTTSLTLNGEASSTNDNKVLTYAWITSDGNIVSGASTLTPSIDKKGTYKLTVTDTDNGCSISDSVIITEDIVQPTAEAGATAELSCSTTSLTLNGVATSANVDKVLTYAWTTSDGNIVSGATTLTPNVDKKGTYTLTVTDTDNGCSISDTVIITEDIVQPTAEAGATAELTCTTTSLTLNGVATSENTDKVLTYAWTTSGGNIVSGATTLTPNVDEKGTYTFTVTDTDNGCSISDTVIITEDIVQPTAEAGATAELTCTTTSLILNGVATSANVDKELTYAWATSDGNIVSGATTLIPGIDKKGTYTLTVTDTNNGCSISDTVIITEDIVQPTAEAGATAELTCTTTSLTLNGVATSANVDKELT
ncbi:MAG: hypothetical protein COB98_10170, partial [Flavobacteriaceae bacterium]